MLTDDNRIEIVHYRLENARRTMKEINVLVDNKLYNTAASRLYYACYYAVSALLVANKITTKSHNGVRQMFNLHCIKTGMFPKSYSRYYSLLFEARQTGDYEDMFDHDEESIGTLQGLAQEIISAVGEKVEQWLAAQSK